MRNEQRQTQLEPLIHWCEVCLAKPILGIAKLAGDAGSRVYYRIQLADQFVILMDARSDPSLVKFISVHNTWQNYNLRLPEIYHADLNQGLVLLEDFGDSLLLDSIDAANVNYLYGNAIDTILEIQSIPKSTCEQSFTKDSLDEQFKLFTDWFLTKHLSFALDNDNKKILQDINNMLSKYILQLPQTVVHLDFHSRNLFYLKKSPLLGIIDFQDARVGPYTYDLVSLLQDAYIKWPPGEVERWVSLYMDKSKLATDNFLQDFYWVGLQRHLKNLGIFARLNYRDNKPGYLKDMPQLLNYILATCRRYQQLKPLLQFMQQAVIPRLSSLQCAP